MITRAVRDGDEWVVTGTKNWITNLGVADFYVVFAKTDPEAGRSRGISAFVVEADRPGFSVGKLEHKLGIKGSPTGQPIFDDVRIPAANLIGEVDKGMHVALGTLDHSRLGVAAQAVGIAQGATDHAAAYARERRQFGQPIADFQGIQFKLADMETRTAAARELLYQACAKIDRGEPDRGKYSAMAKLFASDTAMAVTVEAVQVLGGYGYVTEYPVERYMRDAKITQIYEGTNEIQRLVIARSAAIALDDVRRPPSRPPDRAVGAVAVCCAILVVTLLDGLSDDVRRAADADRRLRPGRHRRDWPRSSRAITGRLADYSEPADEEEFELLVRRSEQLARENLAAEPDEAEFMALDPRNPGDFEELVREALDDLPDLLLRRSTTSPS